MTKALYVTTPVSVRVHAGDGSLSSIVQIGVMSGDPQVAVIDLAGQRVTCDADALLQAAWAALDEREQLRWYQRHRAPSRPVETDCGQLHVRGRSRGLVLLDLPVTIHATFAPNWVVGAFSERTEQLRAQVSVSIDALDQAITWARRHQHAAAAA